MTYFEKHQDTKGKMKTLAIRLMPFILATCMFKIMFWYFEYQYGFESPDLGGILTILGIVIGLILATQLPFAVSKYKEANDNLDNTRAILWNISNLLIRENVKDIAVIVGPEGGLSHEEVGKAEESGFVKASLGPRILRAETASISAMTLIQHFFGDLN